MKAISYIIIITGFLLSGNATGQRMYGNQAVEVLDSVITWKFSGATDSLLAYRINYLYDQQQRMTQSEEFVREQALNLWVTYRKENWQFDTQNRQMLWSVMFWENEYMAYKGLFRERYVFDNQGNVSESYFDGWSLSPFDWKNYKKYLNYYDGENKLTNGVSFEWSDLDQDWDSTGYMTMEYDPQGLLERMTEWEADEESGIMYMKYRYDYEYETDGDLAGRTWLIYNPFTQLWYYAVKEEHMYDAQHRKIHSVYWEYKEALESWIAKEKEDIAWDNAGNMTLYAYYRIGEDTVTWVPSTKSEMVYNLYNRLLKNIGYSGNDLGEWEPGYMREYEYLQDTLLIEDALSQWDAGSATWKGVDTHIYTLDSLNRIHTDSYYKWIVHVQQFELSTRDYYYYSPGESHGVDNSERLPLVLSPNPTRGKVFLSGLLPGPVNIRIYDPGGKNIMVCPNITNSDGKICLDLDCLPPGIYLMNIDNGKMKEIRKLIRN